MAFSSFMIIWVAFQSFAVFFIGTSVVVVLAVPTAGAPANSIRS